MGRPSSSAVAVFIITTDTIANKTTPVCSAIPSAYFVQSTWYRVRGTKDDGLADQRGLQSALPNNRIAVGVGKLEWRRVTPNIPSIRFPISSIVRRYVRNAIVQRHLQFPPSVAWLGVLRSTAWASTRGHRSGRLQRDHQSRASRWSAIFASRWSDIGTSVGSRVRPYSSAIRRAYRIRLGKVLWGDGAIRHRAHLGSLRREYARISLSRTVSNAAPGMAGATGLCAHAWDLAAWSGVVQVHRVAACQSTWRVAPRLTRTTTAGPFHNAGLHRPNGKGSLDSKLSSTAHPVPRAQCEDSSLRDDPHFDASTRHFVRSIWNERLRQRRAEYDVLRT